MVRQFFKLVNIQFKIKQAPATIGNLQSLQKRFNVSLEKKKAKKSLVFVGCPLS